MQPEGGTSEVAAKAGIRRVLRGFRSDRIALVALFWLLCIIAAAVFADLVAPHSPTDQNLRLRLAPPMTPAVEGGVPHILGTDSLGRDTLSRIIHGGRVSMTVGFLSVLLSGTFGVTIGMMAGYYRGRVDDFLSRATDVMIGFPSLLAAMFVLFVVGPGFWNVVLVLAVIRWHVYARVTRGLAMSFREAPFVEGLQAIGCTDWRIILRHLLPNMMSPILVLATLEVALVIISEAGLSFLGFGVQPPTPSWGLEIAGSRDHIRSAWWLVTFPGLTIFLTTLSLNLTAIWARTMSDPAQRWRWIMAGERRGGAEVGVE